MQRSSTFCADGVCCESACSGTCESCGGAAKGKCDPVPTGQDPEKECKAAPRADAGPPPAEQDAASRDASSDGGALEGGGEEDAAGKINLPEAGVASNDETCAGSCNGNRACAFPDKTTTCGTKFCNSATEAGRFACDGKGRCELGVEACGSFSCEGEECRKTCAEQNDCQGTHFCNQQGLCQQKLGNGLGCGNPDQCASGFCVVENNAGVCCNSGCTVGAFGAGATCKRAGAVGQCKCSEDCGTGSCRLFYRDLDGDGFGDINGVPPATAVVGCDNAKPPAGYSATKDDCDDSDARARPGQTEWFADVTLGKGLNDFNCDGVVSKETREYPGASCVVCGEPTECVENRTCGKGSAGVQSRLTCDLYKDLVFCLPGTTCSPYTCGYSKFVKNTAGFTATVPCGTTSSSFRTCGTCSDLIGSAPSSTPSSKQQRCR